MPPTVTAAAAAAVQPAAVWRRGGERSTAAMSDPDTESSGGVVAWGPATSVTSSESDGPRIVLHTTSDDDDEDDDEKITLAAGGGGGHLLQVLEPGSLTPSDPGSDYTSDGTESGTGSGPVLGPGLAGALVRQVEEYLGDAGLARDLFLLKHVRRQREGWISLKLLSSYKKVKKLARGCGGEVLAATLRASTQLEVNPEGTKVRRRAPLPAALLHDAPPSRTVLATHLPAHHTSMADLAVLFGEFGSVASLQVVRPRAGGGLHPALQPLAARLPGLEEVTCALVEYEDVWGAGRALRELSCPPITLHVLRRSSRRPSPSSSRNSPTPTPSPRGRSRHENGVPPDELRQRLKGTWSRLRQHQQPESSNSEGEESPPQGSLSWRRDSQHLTPQHRPVPRPRGWRGSSSVPASPVALRRHQKQGVTRAPRGPDGTKGFFRAKP